MDKHIIDRTTAYRYMGIPFSQNVDEETARTADRCEAELLSAAKPRFTWRIFDIVRRADYTDRADRADGTDCNGIFLEGCDFALLGKSIERHLEGCEKAAIVCVTLSADCDKFIAKMSVRGALEMLVSDALASAYVEQISENALSELLSKYPGYSATWVFGAGYGDFPLDALPKLISAADATRLIGVSTTAANTLTPSKSIVGIAGLSKEKQCDSEKSCADCDFRFKCAFSH